MALRALQIVLFFAGIFGAAAVLSLAENITGPLVFAICSASGFVLAAIGTWILLRVRKGKDAPSLRDLIVDTLHRIS